MRPADRASEPDTPPPHQRRNGPRTARPSLLAAALLLWGGLYAAAEGRGQTALLAAQLTAAAAVWYVLRQAPIPGHLRPRRSWKHAIGSGTVTGLLLAAAGVAIAQGVDLGERSALLQASGADLLAGLAVVLVGAPLAEEMLFRQGIQRQLELARGTWPSIAVSSALFAAAHPEAVATAVGATVLMAAGVAFAQLRRRTGLPGAVCAHSSYNLTVLTAAAVGM